MLANQLPRLMLAMMFLSIVALGYSVKMNQANAGFSVITFSGPTFGRS